MTVEPTLGGTEQAPDLAPFQAAPAVVAAPASPVTRGVCIGIILLSLAALWFTAFDQPLFAPDEGRYGTASMLMADGGSWIIPIRDGQPHLTKPPLTYWLQALSLKTLGHNEFALRLPSLLAASLTLLLAGCFGWRLAGPRVGAVTAAILVMMPLFAGVSHLAITDPLLMLFWFATLAFGYSAVADENPTNIVLFWSAIALGLLTKGPIALTPLGVLIVWMLLGGWARHLKELRPVWGLLSLVPLGVWVLLVWWQRHDVFSIWRHEIVERVTGSGAHTEPIWFYLPVFILGFLPATVMLVIPGWNISFRTAWTKLRAADTGALLGLAVVLPLIMFSAIGGKLWTYVLPLAPPLALLTAMMIERWLSGEADEHVEGVRQPEVPNAVMIVSMLFAAAVIGAALYFDWRRTLAVLPVVALPAAAMWMRRLWPSGPSLRGWGLAGVWLAWSLSWVWLSRVVDLMRQPSNPDWQLAEWRVATGTASPHVLTYGFSDETIGFYARHPVTRVDSNDDLAAALADHPSLVVLIVDPREWNDFEKLRASSSFERAGEWSRWPRPPAFVMRPKSFVAPTTIPSSAPQGSPQTVPDHP